MQKVFRGIVGVVVIAVGAMFGARYLADAPGNSQNPSLVRYSSEEGVTFMYPPTYELSSHTEGNGERQWDVLVLLPKGYVPPVGGEGPPSIGLGIFDNREDIALDRWVTGDARSNWKLAVQDGGLGSTSVGGKSALAYRYSGLYETSAVAVAHNGKIYLFTVGWLTPEDAIRAEFDTLLTTVMFE